MQTTAHLIRLTDTAKRIADQHAQAAGMTFPEWLEWVVLCQEYPTAEASRLLAQRPKRGGNRVVLKPRKFHE